MSTSYAKELEAAERAAKKAGEMLRVDFYRKNGARGHGYDADVDIEVEREIRKILLEIHPSWGYRGEETGEIQGTDEEGHRWLVDPNDGTSAYLKGYRGSAVSIALVRDESKVRTRRCLFLWYTARYN